MIVGVTGAGGFIGRRLCDALVALGTVVKVLTRNADLDVRGVVVHLADLTIDDEQALDSFLNDVDVVFHCAGELKRDDLMYMLHVEGTKRLLAAVSRQFAVSERSIHWVQLSSVGAYGPPQGEVDIFRVVSEASTPMPRGVYEITKTISDELVLSYSTIESRFSCTVIRPSNVIGSGMPNQSFFQLAGVVRRGVFFYIGSGEGIATYVHVDDLVAALIMCSDNAQACDKIYVLSNDCYLKELISALAAAVQVKPPFLRVPKYPLRLLVGVFSKFKRFPLTVERIDALTINTRYSSELIERELGFKFSRSIPDMVAEVLSKPDVSAPKRDIL